MDRTSEAHLLIGYRIDPRTSSLEVIEGTAVIDGESVVHQLSMSQQPHCVDVGRNKDGDLVWVSFTSQNDALVVPSLYTPNELNSPISNSSSEGDDEEPCAHSVTLSERLVPLLKYRNTVLFAAGVAVVAIVCGLLIPQGTQAQPESQPTQAPHAVEERPQVPEVGEKPTESATDAAIDFVLSGKVNGISQPEDISPSALSATVVSQSGDIVLVDVQSNTQEGLTTFATLLLQKSGTAWRIREVFDPR